MKNMKYIYLSIIGLLFLVLIPFSVQAKDIEVTNVEVLEKNHYVSEVNSPSINEDKIDFNLKFEDYEQYITYKITINNNSYYDYTYEINKKDESIIKYEILDEENKINYSSTKDIVLKVWYKEEINEELYNDNKYNIEDKIELKFSGPEITSVDTIEELKKAIENPETGAFFSIIIALIVLIISIIVYKKAKSLSKFKHFIWLILLVPVIVLASSNTISIYLNFNIELDKPTRAILMYSGNVNSRMMQLAGGNDKIVAIKRSFEKNDNAVEVQNMENYSDPSSYSVTPSEYKIYMWYDETQKTIYYYSDAVRVLYHPSGSGFYNNLTNLQEIDDIKTDILYYASYMFNGASSGLESVSLDLSNWNMKNVASVNELLAHFGKDTKNIEITANDWEFNNIKDRNGSYIFAYLGEASEIGKVDKITINANNWKIGGNCYNPEFYEYNGVIYYSSQGAIHDVFYYIGSNAYNVKISAKNWNLENQTSLYELFYGTGNDTYQNLELDVSGLNAPEALTIQKAFISTAQDPYYGSEERNLNVKINVSNWNLPKVVDYNMAFMQVAEYGINELELLGLDTWDVSNAKNMNAMFYYLGLDAKKVKFSDINNWDVSNVEDMAQLFNDAFKECEELELNLSNWDVSNVKNIGGAFGYVGSNSRNVNINVSNWNLSGIESWNGNLFNNVGENAENLTFKADNLKFNTTTSISGIFSSLAYNANNADISISNLKASNNLQSILGGLGANAKSIDLNISNWDLTNVTVNNIIGSPLTNTLNVNINMSNWKINSNTRIDSLFSYLEGLNVVFNLDASNWDLGDATSLSKLFKSTAQKVHSLKLDLSGWDTSNITDMSEMFNYAFNNRWFTVTYDRPYAPPTYHYYEGDVEPTIEIIGIDKWDVSNVTTMEYMFSNSFKYFKNLKLDLSSWNISNLTNANYMFSSFGQYTIGDKGFELNLSGWNINGIANKTDILNNIGNGSSRANVITT